MRGALQRKREETEKWNRPQAQQALGIAENNTKVIPFYFTCQLQICERRVLNDYNFSFVDRENQSILIT